MLQQLVARQPHYIEPPTKVILRSFGCFSDMALTAAWPILMGRQRYTRLVGDGCQVVGRWKLHLAADLIPPPHQT